MFIFIGMKPCNNLVEFLEQDEVGYIITNEKMETKIPGMYIAGDIRSKPFRQIITACADGSIAATCAREYIAEQKNEEYC